jgi:hypothetical protein
MATVMDIMFSMVLGSTLLIIVLTANEIAVENHSMYNGDMLVQEMLISTAQVIEGEFRNMGYGVPQNEATILAADTTSVRFLCDLNKDGIIDTVQYALGDTTDLSGTMNERDRYLFRSVNNAPAMPAGVVTLFGLRYLAKTGEVLTTPVASDRLSEIHVVEVTMEVQNPHALYRKKGEVHAGERDALYSSSLWQQTRLASQNSRR